MRQRLWFHGRVGRPKAGASTASLARSASTLLRGTIVVIHGGAINSAMLLPVATTRLSTTIGRTAATPTSISPSSTTAGGMSGSNIHMGLVTVLLFNLSEG